MKMKSLSNLTVEGSVVLHGRDGDVIVKGDSGRDSGKLIGQARVERVEGQTIIHSEGSVVLSLPEESYLTVAGPVGNTVLKQLREVMAESCHGNLVATHVGALHVSGDIHGDAVLRHIDGVLLIQEVHGDLAIHQAGTVQATHVHGDAAIHQVGSVTLDAIEGDLSLSRAGEVTVGRVAGDASLSHLSGATMLEQVEGSLSLSHPGSSLHAPQVMGDAALGGALQPGGEYTLQAAGTVRVKVEGDVRFTVHCEGEIQLGPEVKQDDDDPAQYYLGQREGAAHVTIESEGDVFLNWDDESPSEAHRSRRGRRHEVHMDEEVRRAMREARGEVHRARAEVQTEMRRVKQSIRDEMKRALREADAPAFEGAFVGESVRSAVQELLSALRPERPAPPPAAPVPPSPPAAPVPPREELQTILEMVQQGAITPEQAEGLIEALGT